MWKWLTEGCKMPKFVWLGVLVFLLALSYKIITAGHVLINLNERSLEVAKAERYVAEKEKRLIEVSDQAIEHLEKAKTEAPPSARPKFEIAQMAIRDDVKKPMMKRVDPKEWEEAIKRRREAIKK